MLKENVLLSKRYVRDIENIFNKVFVPEMPIIEDINYNTDVFVVRRDKVRYLCHVRRFDPYYKKYKHEFTVRVKSSFQKKAELELIMDGWGDCFFYCYENPNKNGLHSWKIADLNCFRKQIKHSLDMFNINLGSFRSNHDGSAFRAFKWTEFPEDFVVAQFTPEEPRRGYKKRDSQEVWLPGLFPVS